jgi:hypothetical protein
MYKATVEPMPDNPPDRVLYTGLWRVVIYDEKDNFVRTDKEYISYFEAQKLSEDLNNWLNIKSRAAGS